MTPPPSSPAPSDPGGPKPVAGATSDSRPPPVTPYDETVQLNKKTDRRTKSEPALPDEASNAPYTARFGKFIRTKRLGAGGMGEVWKAWDTVLGRWVALKFLKGGDDDEIARFRREAQTAGRLHHPNIAAIFEVDEDQGRHYIAMQFVDGQTLHAFPRDDRKAVVALIADAAKALQYAHEQGVIHRDLKPENLMVTARGKEQHLYVMDFGLARLTEGASKLSVSGYVVGTPSYMSPEQARGEKVDARSDVYSLGVTLYELLTGRRPFESDNVYETLRRVQEMEPLALRKIDPKLADDLETIVLKCMAKEPAGRYETAQALADDLVAFGAGEPIRGRRESLSRKLVRRVRRHPVAFAGAIVLVAGLAAAGVIASGGTRDRRLADLSRQFEEALRGRDWPRAIASPAGDRDRIRSAMAESIRADLAAGQLPPARATLDLLGTLDATEAARLRNELRLRESAWPAVFSLEAPFAESRAVFGSAVRVEAARLSRIDGPPVVLTRMPCEGGVELKAEFEPLWKSAESIGLVLNGTKNGGYRFLYFPREYRVRILRHEALVLEAPIPGLADGPLRLMAKREGDRLAFQVNDAKTVEARDPFAVGMTQKGVFGVHWPMGVGLVRLLASHRELPPKPNALEKADDLFVQGKYEEALQAYRQAALAAATAAAREEARYKEGLCELQSNRPEEAIRVFEEVVSGFLQAQKGSDTSWLFMADCQLLGHYFKQKDGIEKAAAVLDRLKEYGYGFDQLALLMPADVRGAIVYNNLSGSVGQNLHRRPEDHLARTEFSVKASQLIEPKVPDYKWHAVLRAQMLMGAGAEAMRTAERMFRDYGYRGDPVDDYCWLLRLEGKAEDALRAVERAIPADAMHFVERARIHAALKKWDDAGRDLEEYFKKPKDYHSFSSAALIQGFVFEQQGAPAEKVQEAWKRGLVRNWRSTGNDKGLDLYEQGRSPLGMSMLHHWIMASLTGEMTDADAEQLLSGLMTFAGKDNPVFNRLMRPSVLRATWRTPRGREVARQLAFRTVPFSDAVRYPLFMGWIAFIHEVCFPPEPLSADHDEVLWRFAHQIYDAYRSGLITERFFLPFGAIVQGNPNSPGMGWKDVAKLLESAPRLRGPLAYIFGHRYVKKGDAANALIFFKGALHDSGRETADPLLRRLAQGEIEKLEAK